MQIHAFPEIFSCVLIVQKKSTDSLRVMQVFCDTTPGDLTYWTLEHILFIDGTLVIDLLMQWERMCRTTASFESVMCFQYPKTLDLEISWTFRLFRLGEMTSSVHWPTFSISCGLFAAKLCYRHILKTAPEVKAKLGDDLEVFRPARWIAPEARKLLKQNSKHLCLSLKIS